MEAGACGRVTVRFKDRVASFFSFWEALVEVADMSSAKLTFSTYNDDAGATTALVSWNGKAIAKSTKRSLHEAQNEAARLVLTDRQLLGFCIYSHLPTYSGWCPPDLTLGPHGSKPTQAVSKPVKPRAVTKAKASRQRPTPIQVQLPSSFHNPTGTTSELASCPADFNLPVKPVAKQLHPSLSALSLHSPTGAGTQQPHMQTLLQSLISKPSQLLSQAQAMDLLSVPLDKHTAPPQSTPPLGTPSALQQLAALSLPSPSASALPNAISLPSPGCFDLSEHPSVSLSLPSLAIIAQLAPSTSGSLPSPHTINLPTPSAFSLPSPPSISLPPAPALSIPPLTIPLQNLSAPLTTPPPLFSLMIPPLSVAPPAPVSVNERPVVVKTPGSQLQHLDADDTLHIKDQLSHTDVQTHSSATIPQQHGTDLTPTPTSPPLKRLRAASLVPDSPAQPHLPQQPDLHCSQGSLPQAAPKTTQEVGSSRLAPGTTNGGKAAAGTPPRHTPAVQPHAGNNHRSQQLQQSTGAAKATATAAGSYAAAANASKGKPARSNGSQLEGGEAAANPKLGGATSNRRVPVTRPGGKASAAKAPPQQQPFQPTPKAPINTSRKQQEAGSEEETTRGEAWGSPPWLVPQAQQHYDSDVMAGASGLFALMQSAS